MNKIHLDVETYSSEDISKSGAYKYCESVDFEILLLSYAFNDEPVECIDLAAGEEIPERVLSAFKDSTVEKHAFNANFERNAFKAIGIDIPIEQWHCSAIKAAYCGFPLKLSLVSEAMNLGDKAKLTTGNALIKFFCCPIRPTKANGGRERNLWFHDIEKWQSFKEYCNSDVEAERAVYNNLIDYTIPDFERQLYFLDQEINDLGIEIDQEMAIAATKLDEKHSKKLKDRIINLTGVQNPNSHAQIKKWLSEAMGKDIKSLAKDVLPELLAETESPTVREVLDLRSRTSKSSIKKYTAMLNCVCYDGRAHGLFQFYGANRTGRWAGRLIQLQNLKRNYLKEISRVREDFKYTPYEDLSLSYANISDTLSQLVRTAFVAKSQHIFSVADFSAIEARVTAWLAGERWRLQVFETHGKIYEASASMMFGIPFEEVTKGSDARQKGKVAELALGYGGSVGALKKMGGEDMGLTETEMEVIVSKWREKSPNIVKFWKCVENAAKKAIQTGKAQLYRNLIFDYDGRTLTIQLPSGRKLFYQDPKLKKKRIKTKKYEFETVSITYMNLNQETRKWERVDTYGGKLTENIVQAVARDILAFSMLALKEEGFSMAMHVHDEVVSEILNDNTAEENLEAMCEIMSRPLPWSTGLPLAADGYLTTFYMKD